jgi:peptide/nickel transport system ATP-binding protein
VTALLEINGLAVRSTSSGFAGWLRSRAGRTARVVNGLSLELARGETLGIIGERGSGKSKLALAILGLVDIEAGDIHFDGQSLRTMKRAARAVFRRRAQMIFRSPSSSLNPRLTVGETLAEPLQAHRLHPSNEISQRVADLLALAGLPPDCRRLRPGALTDGDCQRVAIARSLSLGPELLIADDPVAQLDTSIQAQILNLIAEFRRQMNFSLIVIAQDIGVARQLCQRLAVMYLGRIVEDGPTEEIIARPRHPYTQALLAAMPKMRPDAPAPTAILAGDPPSGGKLPAGCAFHPRCARVGPACRIGLPPVRRNDGSVTVWCHLYPEGGSVRR